MKKPKLTEAQALARSLEWKEAFSRDGWGYTATHEGHTLELWQEMDPWGMAGDQDRACTCLFLGGSRHTGKPWKAGYNRPLDAWDKAENEGDFWDAIKDSTGLDRPSDPVESVLMRYADLALVETQGLNQCQELLCYITKEDLAKEWGKGPQAYRKARKYLKAVMTELQQVDNGEMGGFSIEGPICEDSCGGFVGMDELKEAACESLLASLAREKEEAAKCEACTRL